MEVGRLVRRLLALRPSRRSVHLLVDNERSLRLVAVSRAASGTCDAHYSSLPHLGPESFSSDSGYYFMLVVFI